MSEVPFKNDANEKRGLMASKTGTNVLFFPKKLKQSPEALPLMNGGLKVVKISTLPNHLAFATIYLVSSYQLASINF